MFCNANLVRKLELIAFAAWPSLEHQRIAGWIARASNGVTRRANSAFTLNGSSCDYLSDAIKKVIDFYQVRNLIPRFQMTHESVPNHLDAKLAELGFTIELEVSIQTTNIETISSIEPNFEVIIDTQPSSPWLNCYVKGNQFTKESLNTRSRIIRQIQPQKAFAAVTIDKNVFGIGLGVIEKKWLGLFSLTVLPKFRRLGIATAINHALAVWAKNLGAEKVYLQVWTKNESAMNLYQKISFKEAYRYWYRWLPENI